MMSPRAVLVPHLLINNESLHVHMPETEISKTTTNLKNCHLRIPERSIRNNSSHKHDGARNVSSEKCQYARKFGSQWYDRTRNAT
eukprot:4767459-Ditylum_brightwellii.AAC.1